MSSFSDVLSLTCQQDIQIDTSRTLSPEYEGYSRLAKESDKCYCSSGEPQQMSPLSQKGQRPQSPQASHLSRKVNDSQASPPRLRKCSATPPSRQCNLDSLCPNSASLSRQDLARKLWNHAVGRNSANTKN